jgi:hypothetical protein
MIQRTTLPDLVVDRIVVTSNNVEVVVRNQGGSDVIDPFWVDAYIDPKTAPRQVNQTWPALSSQGFVWGITGTALPLKPGATLTLSIGDAYYSSTLSQFSGTLPTGTAVYAQVDSANVETTYGAVLEDHEQAGEPYNNISGPITTTTRLHLNHFQSELNDLLESEALPVR